MYLLNHHLEYNLPRDNYDILGFSSNQTLDSFNELVMGAGAAKAFKKAFPDSPAMFGKKIVEGETGLLLLNIEYNRWVFAFPVKNDWKDKASMELLRQSTKELRDLALKTLNFKYQLNCPGIGYGGLSFEEVKPIIETLPDNVFIYK